MTQTKKREIITKKKRKCGVLLHTKKNVKRQTKPEMLHTLEYCTETLRLRNRDMTLARRLEFVAM